MKEKLNENLEKAIKEINDSKTINDLNLVKSLYLGKKSLLTDILKDMSQISDKNQKASIGKEVNEFKNQFNNEFDKRLKDINEEILNDKLKANKTDISLPGLTIKTGSPSIIEKVIEDLEELFISMGYDVVEGPEVEKDLYNFEYLNLPKGNPVRDAQDTFYIYSDELLLRSQTSPVQIRTMIGNKEKTSIRIICPGKTYRRDYDDATHSHQFTQIEGLLVDKDISLSHLKGTLSIMVKHLFGENVETRFRSSFYPFTEPSIEFDISCFKCKGKGCPICKHTGWITVGGAGVVHPNVLKNCDYDPSIYTGFAFGFGVERIAMIKYGINDIRHFYTNDMRINEFMQREETHEN